MYIIKNAWKSIIRNKGRNLLMIIIALVIAIAACVSLSIREAAKKAKEETLASLSVTAQLTFDRTAMMSQMQENMREQQGGMNGGRMEFDRGQFDFNSLMGATLSIDDYMNYTEFLGKNDTYYYSLTSSFNASGDILPYGTDETETTGEFENSFGGGRGGMMGGGRGMMMARGDFSVIGYSGYDAMLSMFGNDGTYSVTEGEMFEETSETAECIISDELAMYNNLAVGDVITLVNPDCADETYDVTVSGIYTNSASDAGNSRFMFMDPANNIYMNATALQNILNNSAKVDNVSDEDETTSAVLTAETNFTYILASAQNYYAFEEAAVAKGLPENYTITSADIASYEESVSPLETLSTMTGWFFVIVLAIGGIILVVLNIFNLRERKYEVGVLTAIGMKKSKVAMQFVCELFIITFTAIIIGTGIGASVSVPVTNSLLQSQIEEVQQAEEEVAMNFGMGGMPGRGERPNFNRGGNFANFQPMNQMNYIDSVSSATDLTVVIQLVIVGILLTIVSSLAALITIMRYEPLKILSSRS